MKFLLNRQVVEVDTDLASQTVLSYLREVKGLTGTKEGCASGDCGACTVVVGECGADGVQYKAINSCVTFMSSLHGKQLLTVEHLKQGEQLHPVQEALVAHHGSQCGFCTPGFVMSMFALYQQGKSVKRSQVEEALSGNLCRCTGYRPIIDACVSVCETPPADIFSQQHQQTKETLQNIQRSSHQSTLLPNNNQDLAQLKKNYPDAMLFAGSTDVALEHTQQWKTFGPMINVSNVEELNQISQDLDGVWIGAAVTISKAEPTITQFFPTLKELLSRFASLPIRNQGTLGGNIANGSPIGDFAPVMLALEGKIKLTDGKQSRLVESREFFTGYRQTLMKQEEWIESLYLPFLRDNEQLKAYKVSKRYEDDISTVCAVFKLGIIEGRVTKIRTGFGGVAATPQSATALEQGLDQHLWNQLATLKEAKNLIQQAFNPIDDVRGSADYRRKLLKNLIHRLWLETTNNTIATRVVEHA
jgi:xanthine dehydrogenase small subunit